MKKPNITGHTNCVTTEQTTNSGQQSGKILGEFLSGQGIMIDPSQSARFPAYAEGHFSHYDINSLGSIERNKG